jgi:type III secretion protein V
MRIFVEILNGISQRLGGARSVSRISKASDVALAVLVVSILMMMIVPLPLPLIDLLLALNISASVMLIMVSLYIPSAVHLSIFPSLLLITTLFRLGLNISTTRMILLKADAGQIIETFGNFVVQGNFVVGAVIFLIITLVQFLVITKGAERVAEVAARFTLDAMPGKQMSIDADLRAGTIDQNKARDMRSHIQKESQLYGAMDGAMKFVKGDAIAGIIITLINIIAGIIIGMTMRDMSAGDAVKTFSLLSIGDGLVSQIPALLISITAGIVTTRVSSDKADVALGQEITTQLFKHPKALLLTSGILIVISLIPGMPKPQFYLIAFVIAAIGIVLWVTMKDKAIADSSGIGGEEAAVASGVDGQSSITGGGVTSYALTLPVILEAGKNISALIKESKKDNVGFIEQMIPRMRQALYQDLGVRFPGVHVRLDSPTLEDDEYAILLNEVPITKGKIIPNNYLTNEIEENLQHYNLAYTSYKNAVGMPSLWVELQHEELLKKAGIKFWKPLEVIILHISFFFRQYANEFLGIQEVKAMLEFMEKNFPDLVKEVTRLIPLQKLTDIFKRLIQEQVSIKDLRTVLESLSEWAQTEKDTVLLTEYVRSSLKRYISYKHSQGQTVLSVYILDPEIEDMVRGAIKQTSSGSYLALDPDSVQLILQAIRNTVTPVPPGGQPPVMLTAIDVRRFVRKLVEMEHSEIAVVSYQEIIPEIRIQPLGRIQIS